MFTSKGAKKRSAIWSYFERTEDRDTHSCKACLKCFSCKKKNTANLARHLRVVHERLYNQFMKECGYSEEEIATFKETKKHNPSAKDDPATLSERTCTVCQKVYSTKKNMELHRNAVHSGVKPFKCDQCGLEFARKESFKRHSHSGFKPFLCSVCGKTFARRHIRDVHERAHYGDKRYSCSYCEKRFTSNQKKQIHERVHTGEKPFACNYPGCTKRFAQQHQLQTHLRVHTGAKPYKCEFCK